MAAKRLRRSEQAQDKPKKKPKTKTAETDALLAKINAEARKPRQAEQPASESNDAAPAVSTSIHQRHGDRGAGENAASAPLGKWIRFKHLQGAGLVGSWAGLLHLIA